MGKGGELRLLFGRERERERAADHGGGAQGNGYYFKQGGGKWEKGAKSLSSARGGVHGWMDGWGVSYYLDSGSFFLFSFFFFWLARQT